MKYLSLAILITATLAALIQEPSSEDLSSIEDPPKLPMYIGTGYHLAYGNPKNQKGLDPGFYHQIFDYTFSKKKTTEDGKYMVPDQVQVRKMSVCSFSTDVKSFRGTQSYQQDLKQSAKVEAGYEGIGKFSFSLSTTYQKMSNSTLVQKSTITHATAECQAYELSTDKFAIPDLSNNFKQGAIKSLKNKNWTDFIGEFGTHYAHQLIMGGRATQEMQYSYQSISKMQSLDIDVNVAAKASFAKFYADSSYDWSKHTKEISYAQMMSSSTRELYIGGEPPRDGKIHDWQVKIIDNPQPVSYQLYSISSLFEEIKDSEFNHTLAVSQFEDALKNFCVTHKCPNPSSDFPKPKPATTSIEKSKTFGFWTKNKFDKLYNSTTLNLKGVHLKYGKEINNIQLQLSDGITHYFTQAVGGNSGTSASWTVPDGEYVSQIEIRCGCRLDSLTFITNKGHKSPKYGQDGGHYELLTIPNGYRIVGFFGQTDQSVYGLGFYFAKTILPVNGGAPYIDVIRQVIGESIQ